MKAWTFQRAEQIRDLGEQNAPWYVGWLEPDGRRRCKSCGVGPRAKRNADRKAAKLTSELMTGTYQIKTNIQWDEFVKEYTRRVLDGHEVETKRVSLDSLRHFKRLMRPQGIYHIDTGTVDEFICRRRKEPGKKRGSLVSPATVNKDLRHLKAALNVAVEWGYMPKLPRFRMEKTVKKIPRYVLPEHFALIYQHADHARMPANLPYPAADWWRALLTFIYMTGWRIGDMLALRRDDLDLAGGYALTDGVDNKGDQDARVKLHEVVIEHLKVITSFETFVFPWSHDRATLDLQFDRIQTSAGIRLHCRGRHEHTPACHLYGFHDLRRAFATMNAARLTPDALQSLMRHKSYLTTQVYINISRQLDDAVNALHVPDFLRKPEQGRDRQGNA